MDGLKKSLLDRNKRFKALKDEEPKNSAERINRIERLLGLI